jgi:predicted aminopeptidase
MPRLPVSLLHRAAPALLALALLGGCFHVRYLTQATGGQLALLQGARPIAEVLADPDTDLRTAVLLEEVGHILAFARAQGLASHGNYGRYIELDRPAVVWMITASRPLAFEPKTWWFPIVGSFPYLGWFDWRAARRYATELAADDWDVAVRPVHAYSTGGWFPDPVLSTMLSEADDAFRYLANILLHELVHANILVYGQSTFNESLASFVGDAMTADYLAARFGAGSVEVAAFAVEIADEQTRGDRLQQAYAELEALYASDLPDAAKRERKDAITRQLQLDLDLINQPNNASLSGFATYNAGRAEFAALLAACDRDWPRFLALVDTLESDDFPEDQTEDLGPVIDTLICPADAPPPS